MDLNKIILKYSLQNAINYNGKANSKAVIGKVISENKNIKIKEVIKKVEKIIKKVNSMPLEKQKTELKKLAPKLISKKKKIKITKLPKLRNTKNLVMRFAPNPNGAMSLGHARVALLNWFYTKEYKGKYLLRYDDTDPKVKPPLKEAYKWFIEDLNFLGIKPNLVVKQSDRLDIYYSFAKQLIDRGKAYVCSCDRELKRKLLSEGKACPCRDFPINEQINRWNKMLAKDGYKEGEAVLRIKTDLKDKNPANRDWPALRIVENGKHPFTKAKVWPLLNFASAIDDYECRVSHIVRGIDLKDNIDRQEYIYKYFNWRYPEVLLNGKLLMKGIKSTSQIRLMIENKDISGWDDPRLLTIKALRKRGFKAEAITRFIKELGLNKNDINVSMESLTAFNKDIIDKEADRYFFVEEPEEIKIENSPKLEVSLALHPDNIKKGKREFKTKDRFYIIDKLEENKVYRLIGLFNFKNNKFLSRNYSNKLNATLIHWLPVSRDLVKVEVVMPDNKVKEGLGESSLKKLKVGDIVQFVRVGFCRLDKKDKVYRFYFAHK